MDTNATPEKSGSLSETFSSQASKEDQDAVLEQIHKLDKWEEIGAHRPIGQLWYMIGIFLIILILGTVFLALIVSLVYPWPEIKGYFTIADKYFALVFTIFDVGTAYSIDRFIGEWRIKNPRKMIKYVQFFFWYQMITGLVQILGISVVVFLWVKTSDIGYLSWLFLIVVLKQWPAMATSLKNTINGLQRFDKGTILEILFDATVKDVMSVGFALLGRYLGGLNPQYGELFGATLGLAFGGYFVEIVGILVGVKYFNQVMAPFGYTIKDAFQVDFDWAIAKECLIFGFQVSIIPSVNTLTGTWMLLMYLDKIPQYSTYIFIAGIASALAGAITAGNGFKLTPSIAESYPNGKKKLALFYVETNLKWAGFFMMFIMGVVAGFMPMILRRLTDTPELAQYALAAEFLPFFIFQSLFTVFIDLPNSILLGTMRVTFFTVVRLVEEVMQVFFVWLFLYVFKFQETMGDVGIGLIFGLEHFFPRMIKMALCWIYINRKVFKVKVYWMQSFIIPIISITPVLIISLLWERFVIDPLIGGLGLYVAVGITMIIAMIVLPLLIYLPLTGMLGGWDDRQVEIFRKSIALSGLSKWVVRPFYKMVAFWSSKSIWHNKFRIPWEDAEKEIYELHLLKLQHKMIKVDVKDRNDEVARWFKKRKNS